MNKQPVANNYAFIDSQNLYLGVQELGWRLDYKRFRIYLREKYQIQRAYLFIGYIPEHRPLYNKLRNAGYSIIFKPIVKIPNGVIKGNCDSDLVLQAMIDYPRYDKAIIVSGDGDFYSLVRYLISRRRLLHLIVPNRYKYSSLLKAVITENHFLITMNDLRHLLADTKRRP